MQLSAKVIAALQLSADENDKIYFDDALPGFGLRLRRSSGQIKRTWVCQYKRGGGTRRLKLGSADVVSASAARELAKKALAAVALGQDPQAARRDRRARDAVSLKSVIEQYLATKQPELRPRSFVEVRRYLLTGSYFRALHGLPVDTVSRKDIAARLFAITRESSSNTAAGARDHLHALFVWALQTGLVETNPVLGTIKPR
jgi:hypothetical protein